MTRRLLLPFIALAALLGLTAMTGCAPQPEPTALVQKANALRAGRGVAPLHEHPVLVLKAQSWANTMAAEHRLYHSDLRAGVETLQWRALGENVAYDPGSPDPMTTIHNAFVNSPGHLANLVNPAFNTIGVGVARSADGTVWVAEVFAQL